MIDSSSITQLESARAKEHTQIFWPTPNTRRIEHFYKITVSVLPVTEAIIPNLFPPNILRDCTQYDSDSLLGIRTGYACGLKESRVVDSALWPD